jgi:hypothetical protein
VPETAQPAVRHWLVVSLADEHAGIAGLLDEARREIVAARDSGREPAGLLLDRAMHDLLMDTKRRELANGVPLAVLGLAVAAIANDRT